jgi:hypothetical protein
MSRNLWPEANGSMEGLIMIFRQLSSSRGWFIPFVETRTMSPYTASLNFVRVGGLTCLSIKVE